MSSDECLASEWCDGSACQLKVTCYPDSDGRGNSSVAGVLKDVLWCCFFKALFL